MSYPHPPYPQPGPPNFVPMAYPQPVPLLPGGGALVVTVNRGPYIVPVPTVARLKIDGRQVAIPSEGTWHITSRCRRDRTRSGTPTSSESR